MAKILLVEYGHLRTSRTHHSIDADGRPVAWYTYPALEFLKQFDFSEKTVFEYGAGNSTRFWGSVAKAVVSVEDDERWYERLRAALPPNCTLILESDLDRFPATLDRFSDPFDVIVVDGPARGRTRLRCCQTGARHLRPGGLIILDNADWLPESSRVLREAGLLEVDMTGFAPIARYTQTTSFFFDRQFDFPRRPGQQPQAGIGATGFNWEAPEIPPGRRIECHGRVFGGVTADETWSVATPSGLRTFRIVTYTSRGGAARLAILDVDQGRVLLTHHAPPGRRLLAERNRIRGMSWHELCAFIRDHPKRHCRLDDVPQSNALPMV